MANAQTHYIACGDGYIRAALPEHVRVIGGKRPLPSLPDHRWQHTRGTR